MPSLELVLNVALGGILAGLVYGLMALGLSVIFGVVRVVNFAHGEMMTIAMYLAVTLFAAFGLDPLIMLVPIAAVLFALGYVMQAGLINPFINRPEHSQFMLLVAIGIIFTNVLLIIFGPDAKSVQTSYSLDSFLIGPLISALHVRAVRDIRDGDRPRLASIAPRALAVLPVVSAAVIISTLGIFAGFIALIVPGILLSLRWSVVAQAAALESSPGVRRADMQGRPMKGWLLVAPEAGAGSGSNSNAPEANSVAIEPAGFGCGQGMERLSIGASPTRPAVVDPLCRWA